MVESACGYDLTVRLLGTEPARYPPRQAPIPPDTQLVRRPTHTEQLAKYSAHRAPGSPGCPSWGRVIAVGTSYSGLRPSTVGTLSTGCADAAEPGERRAVGD